MTMRKTKSKSFARMRAAVLLVSLAASLVLTSCLGNIEAETNQQPTDETTIVETSETAPIVETTAEPTPTPEPDLADLPPSEDAPVVALTFDDGPSLRDTGTLLDLLAAEEVPATFFVIGSQVEIGREELVKRAYDEGHEIGNHTYSHQILTTLDQAQVRQELSDTSDMIENIIGSKPTVMRPPTGAWSDDIAAASEELGMAVVNWNWQSCPEDWNHHDDPQHISDFVIETAQNGHIILLHDTNEATVASMPDMIAGLKERGFRFMTVSQMLEHLGEGHPQAGGVYHTYAQPEN
ncbi:MAG: polysaccharide deacetylase family protein [Clostridiaceae bacterium]|nr:polysaccharide deacetylase family protein [Clostridiaceae bacterium]